MSAYSTLIKKLSKMSGKEAEEAAAKLAANLSDEEKVGLIKRLKATREADKLGGEVIDVPSTPIKKEPEIIRKKSIAELNKESESTPLPPSGEEKGLIPFSGIDKYKAIGPSDSQEKGLVKRLSRKEPEPVTLSPNKPKLLSGKVEEAAPITPPPSPPSSLLSKKTAATGLGVAAAMGGSGFKSDKGTAEVPSKELAGGQSEAKVSKDPVIQAASSPKATSQDTKKAVTQLVSSAQKQTQAMGSPDSSTAAPATEEQKLKDYKPLDLTESIAGLDAIKNSLPARDKTDFDAKLKQLQDKYDADKKLLENRELAETLVHAFTQLAAGIYGLNTGMDMSGLKFDKQDWSKKTDMAFKEYESLKDYISKEKDTQTRLQEKDTDFVRDIDLKKVGLKGQQQVSEIDMANKKISDENRAILQAAQDKRRAEREKLKLGQTAAEAQKDRDTKIKIAEIQAKAAKERAAISSAARQGTSKPASTLPPKEEKPVVDQTVKTRLSRIDATLKSLNKPGFEEQAKATLKSIGYTDDQIKEVDSKGSWLPGKPSKKSVYADELAKQQDSLSNKLYTTPSQIRSGTRAAPVSNTVKIIDPLDGKVKTIPKEALQEALQDGAKLVE